MEAFKLMATDDDDEDAPLQHTRESQTSHSSSSNNSPTTPPRPTALEPDDEKTSRVFEKKDDDEVLKTPNSAVSKIRPASTCPPAPRKPKASPPMPKRKGSHKLLDLSNDVLSLYPPALLADFNNKLKKARRDVHHDQQKENICSNTSQTKPNQQP